MRSLAAGGTCYFAARSDLSTLLEDLALVRPTELNFVPRVWEMIHSEFQSRVDQRLAEAGEDARAAIEAEVLAEVRDHVLGGRFVAAMTGSAPISAELKNWTEDMLGIHLLEGYGSTEAGMALFDGVVQRPPVIDYKLVDVPDLGYFGTDQPHPRGELLIKTENLFPGYYKRSEVTASVFDGDGFYRTGDVVARDRAGPAPLRRPAQQRAQARPGRVRHVGQAGGGLRQQPTGARQIYVCGNSAPALSAGRGGAHRRNGVSKEAISESLQEVARDADLQSYEIPRDFIVETTPFSLENGLLTGIRKLAWPKLKAHYGERLEQLYTELAETQAGELSTAVPPSPDAPVLETVSRAAGALLGAAAARPGTRCPLHRSGWRFVVGVDLRQSPARDLRRRCARRRDRQPGQRSGRDRRLHRNAAQRIQASDLSRRCTDGTLPRSAAADLTLDKFLDADTLAAAPNLPKASSEVRTVLLTGATGFLGRYLALEWLERMDLVDGKVIALVRAKSDEEARARLDATFDSAGPNSEGDAKLLAHYQDLAADHLEVIAGDKGEENLGLDQQTWQRLADEVDLIVDPAAPGQPRAALQRTVRAQRARHRRADQDRAHHQDQAVHLRVDHRRGRLRSSPASSSRRSTSGR